MKQVKFNKTICGVDFLLNILELKSKDTSELSMETQSTDFFQIIFIKKASGRLLLNHREIELYDNSIIFISQHQKHQWKIDNDTFEAQILVFQEDFLNDFFADKYFTFRLLYFYQTDYNLEIKVENDNFENYIAKLIEIKRELSNPQSDSVHIIRSILYYILIQLNRTYSEKNNIQLAIAQDNIAYQFRKLVEQHIYFKQRVEDYSTLMNISRITLNKSVKSQFNTTATEFIKSRLIFEIKMKLIYSNQTISEISNELNFSESNHLSRLFKKKESISPAKFRTTYQNGRLS